jgi:sugar/nucleoside kinase (ribokinase family)
VSATALSSYRYDSLVAAGGVGAGIAFQLLTGETLGRNESRPAVLLSARDYCKGHVVLHYVATLLRTGLPDAPKVVPIGRVGDDRDGHRLLEEMRATGMSTEYVIVDPDLPTLYSVSYQYPDSSGGNLTACNSASGALTTTDVARPFEASTARERTVVVALPEVPLDARLRLLQYGREREALTVASIVPEEAVEFEAAGGWELVDIAALNVDEAAAVARVPGDLDGGEIARRCAATVSSRHPDIVLIVTDGRRGNYLCAKGEIEHTPALAMTPVSTAGAGDAFLAGVIVGLMCGLPLHRLPATDSGLLLSTAVDLGALLGSLSIASPHTINPEVDAAAVAALIAARGLHVTAQFESLFTSRDRLMPALSPMSRSHDESPASICATF